MIIYQIFKAQPNTRSFGHPTKWFTMVLIVGSAALNYFEMVHNVGNQEIQDFFSK